ncbi:S-layer homology domain-containing protein [Arthrobacter sp. NPDC080031]|uniref:RCC1 domain-containing protein n=1 Tax=Arthrobacter sp. NPDC080031 TaxID=3155918 RepID=UPI00344D87E9
MSFSFRRGSFTGHGALLVALVLLFGLLPAGTAMAAPTGSTAAAMPGFDPSPTPTAGFTAAQPAGVQAPSFADVDSSNPFYAEISWLASTAVSTGYTDHTYRPVVPVNRDAMAAFMYRLAGKPEFTAPPVSPFTDVTPTTQFYKEITWLADQGVSTGWTEANGSRSYRPIQPVNRDAMAAFMYRLAGKPSYTPPAISAFTDAPVGSQFYSEISWLASAGISTGYADHTYRPVVPVNRDAMAAFMYRFVGRAQEVTTTGNTINVGPAGAGHASALIRLSTTAPTLDTVISAAGTPAFIARAGTAASTTVLVPLAGETARVSASTAVAVKMELLATFDGTPAVPGSTIVLPQPVTRADTANGLGGNQLSTTPITIGLTGSGGVPSTGVRAVYATATVQASAPTTLAIGAQSLPIPAGSSTVTTVVTPDDGGNISASLGAGSGSLRLDVRGYTPDAVQDAGNVNVPGSFVPAVTPVPSDLPIASGTPTPVNMPGLADRSYTLALVAATGSRSTARLAIGTDNGATTRGQGILVDAAAGAGPQLVLIPESSQPAASLAAGNTTVTMEPVGDILSATPTATSPATVQITAPTDGSTVDLSTTGTIELKGTLTNATVATKSVTISTAGSVIGSAVVKQTPGGTSWSYRTGIPQSGTTSFTVNATDRAGSTGTATVTVNAVLPSASTALTAPGAVVLDNTRPSQQLTTVTADKVAFAQAPDVRPGQVIVSAPTNAAPAGILRTVTAINKTSTGWVADTAPAALTDAIHQASIDQTVPLTSLDPTAISTNTPPAPDDTPDVTVAGTGPAVTTATGTAVDLAPLPSPGSPQTLPAAMSAFTTPPKVTANSVGVDSSYTSTLSIAAKFAFDTNGHKTDYSSADDAATTTTKATIRASGGVTAEAKSQIGIGIHFRLMISMHFNWGIPSVKVDDFSVILSTNAKTGITADAYLKVQTAEEIKKTIALIHLPPLNFLAGPVPVIVLNTATITFNSELTAETAIHVESNVQRTQDYGFHYSTDHGIHDATTAPVTTLSNPLFGPDSGASITGKIDASMGPTIDLTSKIYDVAGPVFTIGAKVGATGEATIAPTGPEFKITAFLEGSISVGVKLAAPVIDKVLLDATLINLTARWSLGSWTLDYATEFPGLPLPPSTTPTPPTITTTSLLPATAGTFYSSALSAAGGTAPYFWRVNGALPAGLSLEQSTGAITGIPTGPGSSDLTVAVTDSAGSTATGTVHLDIQAAPAGLMGAKSVTASSSSVYSVFVVKTDGTVWGWGYNGSGQLGDGTISDSAMPVQAHGLNSVQTVFTGSNSTYALKTDGTVWAWGSNSSGQLGDGTNTSSSVPVQVAALSGVQSIASTGSSVLAVKTDGTVWAWGWNADGQLGNGTTTSSSVPVQVPGLTGVQSLVSNGSSVLTLKTDGTVWAWGANVAGQLGIGTTASSAVPVRVTGMSSTASISINGSSAFAVKTDGTAWAWGWNAYGQLGNGSTANSSVPVQVAGLSDVRSISSSGTWATALKGDGTVWAWGDNLYGQLGNGTATGAIAPVQVSGLAGIQSVTTLGSSATALKSDGTIWVWGNNSNSLQFGAGTINSATPTQLKGLSSIQALSASAVSGYALRADTSVWAWGNNHYGQLGNGTTTDSAAPVQVGTAGSR